MKILGIDPGTNRIGYGLIEKNGELKLIDYGVIEIKKKSSVLEMTKRFSNILKKFRPDLAAIEKIYFSKNRKTALNVSQAKGMLILKVLENRIPLVEYGPMEIKLAVTGYGLADKKAVAKMVKIFLKLKKLRGYDDASDALAIAITAANQIGLTGKIAKI